MKVSLFFEPRDLWVGVFWDWTPYYTHDASGRETYTGTMWKIYVCLLPTVVLLFSWKRPDA